MKWKSGKVRNIHGDRIRSVTVTPPGRAFRYKDKYRDYRAKVRRSIATNQLDALESPARGLSSSTPHRQGGNESDEEERGRVGRDLKHGLGYWESLQNSVRLKRSTIRPQTVSATDVYVSGLSPAVSPSLNHRSVATRMCLAEPRPFAVQGGPSRSSTLSSM